MPGRRRRRCGWGLAGARTSISLDTPFEPYLYLPVKEVAEGALPSHIELCDYEVAAMYLVHVEGLSMEEAARRMSISKPTFWRILEQARFKVAKALAERLSLKLVSCKYD
jgi:predicted DNA-binding protein (UPF0251 family)